MPGPASGLRSRTTRWAARSKVVHPSHSVGASGPSSSKRAQICARSRASRGVVIGASLGAGSTDRVAAMASAPEMQIDHDTIYQVTIATDRGDILLELDPKLAPKSVNNFVALARKGYYDGLTFHRVVARLRDPGRVPRGQRPGRSRLQVRGRAGEGRLRAGRRRHGERRPEHERQPVLHLPRRPPRQARQELQPVRLHRRRHGRRPARSRSAT